MICFPLQQLKGKLPSRSSNRWLFFSMLLLFSFSSSSLFSQVSGIVMDQESEPLIGVNIFIKGTTTGTISDFDGSFAIDAESSDTLVFSYTGYKTESFGVQSTKDWKIVLAEDSEVLDEVVVIGYGVQRKSDLTGSVASLDGSSLTAVVAGNPTSALQGKLSGIQVENNGGQPGGASNVFVRGVSSLTNSFPLYVVDGTFVENMNFLNPKDIESIEVLKDASSAAIYGSRAANGVVLITTKRGEAGPTKISVDVRGGFETPNKMLDFLSGPEFVEYRNQLEQNDNTGNVLSGSFPDTDWQDLSLNPGSIQDYGLSVSGGSETSSYFISGNYFGQDGILVGSGFERLNFRANGAFELGKLKIQQSLSFAQSKLQDNNWFGFDGATAPILRESAPENDGGFEAPERDVHFFGGINAFGLATLEDNELTTRNLLGNINFSYEILPDITAKINLGADYRNQHSFFFVPTYFMSNTDAVINLNTQNDLTEARSETLVTLIEPTLSYNKVFGESRIDVVLGATQQNTDFRNVAVYVQNLPTNETQVIGAADPSNVQALDGRNNKSALISYFGRVNYTLNNKYLFSGTLRRDASSKFSEDFRVGYFPSFSVGWNMHYEPFWNSNFVTRFKLRGGYGTLGSQNIPDYSYQSVVNLTSPTSFNNVVTNGYSQTALALQDLRWETARTINIGADIGILNDKFTGSIEYYNKQVEDVLVGVNIPASTGFSSAVIQNAGSFENSGVDLELVYHNSGSFKYDIGFNLATYSSEITQLPNTILGPSTSEDQTRVNRFIEGERPGVYYGFITDGVYADQAAIDNDPNIRNDESRKSVIQPGDFIRKDLNGDGLINEEDRTILGDPTPTFTYGFNFSGSYKQLDFGVFFQGVQGNEIYNVNKFYNIFWADDNKLTDVLRGWTPDNRSTDIPRATAQDPAGNREPSSFFVEDGSYLRLRTLEIGYTVNKVPSWMSSLRFSLTAQNLLTLTGYSGYNPDISSTNGGRANRDSGFQGNRVNVNPLLGRGLDVRAYPNTISLLFGVQATF